MSYEHYIPDDIRQLYEIHNFRNAAQILSTGATEEFKELLDGFRNFRLTIDDIRKPGGNESDIPKKISVLLRKYGWLETRIKGDLTITKTSNHSPKKKEEDEDTEEDETETLEKIEELKKRAATLSRSS